MTYHGKGAQAASPFVVAFYSRSVEMQSKIAGIGLAAAFAALLATSPSFGQSMLGTGSPPPAAAPAPAPGQQMAPQGGAVGRGGVGGISPRSGNRSMTGGGGGNRQAWTGRQGGYRGGYRGGGYRSGVYFGGGPFYGPSPYAYDDDYYVDAPAAVGGDVDYCVRRFRSYDVRSGTYLGNDGRRHACP